MSSSNSYYWPFAGGCKKLLAINNFIKLCSGYTLINKEKLESKITDRYMMVSLANIQDKQAIRQVEH